MLGAGARAQRWFQGSPQGQGAWTESGRLRKGTELSGLREMKVQILALLPAGELRRLLSPLCLVWSSLRGHA